ncbi:MAG: hypothetical protein WCG26_07855 [Chloroflexales bacterium]
MPYVPISNLSRRGEKVAPFVSIQNAVGMVIMGALGWSATGMLPVLPRTAVVLMLMVNGYMMTVDVRGMSFYERRLWQLRGIVRSLLRGREIRPDDLPGTLVKPRILVSQRDGMVRPRQTIAPTLVRPSASSGRAALTAPRPLVALVAPPTTLDGGAHKTPTDSALPADMAA